MGVERITLIEDINQIRDLARRTKRLLPSGTYKRKYFDEKMCEKFEEHRKVNPVVEDVIQGKGDTTFLKEVSIYTKPRGKIYYPHLERIDSDRLKHTEMCVEDFYENNHINIIGNPVSMTITSGGVVYGTMETGRVAIGKGIGKKITRRSFLKVSMISVGVSAFVGGMFGWKSSYIKEKNYERAEHNAKILDYLKNRLYSVRTTQIL